MGSARRRRRGQHPRRGPAYPSSSALAHPACYVYFCLRLHALALVRVCVVLCVTVIIIRLAAATLFFFEIEKSGSSQNKRRRDP